VIVNLSGSLRGTVGRRGATRTWAGLSRRLSAVHRKRTERQLIASSAPRRSPSPPLAPSCGRPARTRPASRRRRWIGGTDRAPCAAVVAPRSMRPPSVSCAPSTTSWVDRKPCRHQLPPRRRRPSVSYVCAASTRPSRCTADLWTQNLFRMCYSRGGATSGCGHRVCGR